MRRYLAAAARQTGGFVGHTPLYYFINSGLEDATCLTRGLCLPRFIDSHAPQQIQIRPKRLYSTRLHLHHRVDMQLYHQGHNLAEGVGHIIFHFLRTTYYGDVNRLAVERAEVAQIAVWPQNTHRIGFQPVLLSVDAENCRAVMHGNANEGVEPYGQEIGVSVGERTLLHPHLAAQGHTGLTGVQLSQGNDSVFHHRRIISSWRGI